MTLLDFVMRELDLIVEAKLVEDKNTFKDKMAQGDGLEIKLECTKEKDEDVNSCSYK